MLLSRPGSALLMTLVTLGLLGAGLVLARWARNVGFIKLHIAQHITANLARRHISETELDRMNLFFNGQQLFH